MDDERFDAIVVGGGLAGLAAAYTLADAGKQVVVLERGDYCGAKNMTGGRMYVSPIRDMFPELLEKAPFERAVTHEELCVATGSDTLMLRYGQDTPTANPDSYTVSRAKFDKYLSKQAKRKGAVIITKTTVRDLVYKNGKVDGVVVDGDELRADVVLLCDGVLSLLAEKAGLRGPGRPKDHAVGVKEVIELGHDRINERFNLTGDEGAARLYMGEVSAGKFGGGFIYTNDETISVGMVLSIDDVINAEPAIAVPELFDRFAARSDVQSLTAGGEVVEYSAHVIPEGGYRSLTRLAGNGILSCGDAAGFSLNAGITVRGMDYAMASGYLAAQTVIRARQRGSFTAESLSEYERLLEESFVLQDFKTYEKTPEAFENERLFQYYPEFVNGLFKSLYTMPDGPKQRVWPTLRKELTPKVLWGIAKNDLRSFTKL